MGVGRTWHRVESLGEGEFTVETSQATATVRGTAFVLDCVSAGNCSYVVFEGVIEVALGNGSVIEVIGPAKVEVVGGVAGPVIPVTLAELLADPWLVANVKRDIGAGFDDLVTTLGTDEAEPTTTELATTSTTTADTSTTTTEPSTSTTEESTSTTTTERSVHNDNGSVRPRRPIPRPRPTEARTSRRPRRRSRRPPDDPTTSSTTLDDHDHDYDLDTTTTTTLPPTTTTDPPVVDRHLPSSGGWRHLRYDYCGCPRRGGRADHLLAHFGDLRFPWRSGSCNARGGGICNCRAGVRAAVDDHDDGARARDGVSVARGRDDSVGYDRHQPSTDTGTGDDSGSRDDGSSRNDCPGGARDTKPPAEPLLCRDGRSCRDGGAGRAGRGGRSAGAGRTGGAERPAGWAAARVVAPRYRLIWAAQIPPETGPSAAQIRERTAGRPERERRSLISALVCARRGRREPRGVRGAG